MGKLHLVSTVERSLRCTNLQLMYCNAAKKAKTGRVSVANWRQQGAFIKTMLFIILLKMLIIA